MSKRPVQTVCSSCRAGRHLHDRFTDTGADAGCPYLTNARDPYSQCQCDVVAHPVPVERCPTCGRTT